MGYRNTAVCLLALLGPGVVFAQTPAPAPLTPAAPPPAAKALPTDPATGRLLGSWHDVQAAWKRGDHGEAQRLAAWLTSADWQAALSRESPNHLEVALAVLPAQVGAVAWLPVLAPWLWVTEPAQQDNVAKVARTMAVLLDGRQPEQPHSWDVPTTAVRGICQGFVSVASAPARPLETRLAALEALATTRRTCAAPPADLLVDPAPEIRRAAVNLVAGDPATMAVVRARLDDDAAIVESAAAARLCQRPGNEPIPPEVLRAARKFAQEPVAMEDSVELLDCLATSAEPDDRAALENAFRHGGKPIQERAKQLLHR
ncbi:MAG: hypothetical protein SF187_24935 [Deltaproteobacteria bacterium]|nr:hypothetical protein [Deltaproteobacteria bacterium]